MGDYIKRADALRWINNRESLNKYAETGDEQYLKFDAWDARQILDSIPAADVRENVRAKWLPMPEMLFSRRKQCYEPVITHYMCSRCGREEKERWEFCHCGAEMRGADLPHYLRAGRNDEREERKMSEYGSGITMMEGFALDRERIRHAWDGELAIGEDERGFFVYEPADEGDCLAFIIKTFDNAVYQLQEALASGRALEHMLQKRVPDYPYGDAFQEYVKARDIEKEKDRRRADYPFDDDPATWSEGGDAV